MRARDTTTKVTTVTNDIRVTGRPIFISSPPHHSLYTTRAPPPYATSAIGFSLPFLFPSRPSPVFSGGLFFSLIRVQKIISIFVSTLQSHVTALVGGGGQPLVASTFALSRQGHDVRLLHLTTTRRRFGFTACNLLVDTSSRRNFFFFFPIVKVNRISISRVDTYLLDGIVVVFVVCPLKLT